MSVVSAVSTALKRTPWEHSSNRCLSDRILPGPRLAAVVAVEKTYESGMMVVVVFVPVHSAEDPFAKRWIRRFGSEIVGRYCSD